MQKHSLERIINERKAFRDCEKPELGTSGTILVYYVNSERVAFEADEWTEVKQKSYSDPDNIIQSCIEKADTNPWYKQIICAMTDIARDLVKKAPTESNMAIAGGESRDWIFSGPVAHYLMLPHITMMKDGSMSIKDYRCNSAGIPVSESQMLEDFYAVHIGDLVTLGSSTYNPCTNPPTGWIPMLRQKKVGIKDSAVLVDRDQGAKENLTKGGANLTAAVTIDEEFLRKHSSDPERAIAYKRSPDEWAGRYIVNQGIDAFVPYFNPDSGKLLRAARFIDNYEVLLSTTSRLEELSGKVRIEYGWDITSAETWRKFGVDLGLPSLTQQN